MHEDYGQKEEGNPSAAPCFHQQSKTARACMTSAGMLGSSVHSRLAAMKEGGVPKEMSVVELNNDRGGEGFLGYKLCQRIQ